MSSKVLSYDINERGANYTQVIRHTLVLAAAGVRLCQQDSEQMNWSGANPRISVWLQTIRKLAVLNYTECLIGVTYNAGDGFYGLFVRRV